MSRFGLAPHWLCLGCLLVVLSMSSMAVGQGMGPEMYGMVGRFGMGSPVTTRVLGMGGFLSCVNDEQFANPAFAAVQQHASVGVRCTRTEFDNGPTVDTLMGHVTYPLEANRRGFQLTAMSLSSSHGGMMLPGAGPVEADMSETALVVDYGHRISERLTAGMSVLGFENVGLRFTSGFGPVLADVDDSAKWGFRGGLSYEWAPGDFIGALYSFSRDDVGYQAMLPSPVALGLDFDSSQLALGVSRHLAPNLLLAGEFQHGVSSFDGRDNIGDTWHFGAEYLPAPDWALRFGAIDFNFSCGLGYAGKHWRADYAFINGWNDADVGQLFGGSTTHSLQVIYNW